MRELLESVIHNIVVASIGMFLVGAAGLHGAVVILKTLRFIAGELRDEYRALAREIEEWRKFFRGS